MSRHQGSIHVGGVPAQTHGVLGDEAAAVGHDALAEVRQFGLGGMRPDQQAVAASAVHGLDHQLVKSTKCLVALVVIPQQVGGHLLQHGFVTQVVADQVAHEGVDGLVVGNSIAHGVHHRHISRPCRRQQSGHPQARVVAEHHRVEVVIVDAPVHHIHPTPAPGGAHVHHVVVHLEVSTLNQFHAHLTCQKRVLEIGGVIDTGGEHHDGGVAGGTGAGVAQGTQQHQRVVIHRSHPLGGKRLGHEPGHGCPVLQHVRHTAGVAHVVFQHQVPAVVVTHQIDAGNETTGPATGGDAHGLASVPFRTHDQPARDDPVVEHGLITHVEVVEEAVECGHPLDQAHFQTAPLAGRDHPGQQVQREGALGAIATIVAVHREGDSIGTKHGVPHAGKTVEFAGAQCIHGVGHRGVVGSDPARTVEHLVVKTVVRVRAQQGGPGITSGQQIRGHRRKLAGQK